MRGDELRAAARVLVEAAARVVNGVVTNLRMELRHEAGPHAPAVKAHSEVAERLRTRLESLAGAVEILASMAWEDGKGDPVVDACADQITLACDRLRGGLLATLAIPITSDAEAADVIRRARLEARGLSQNGFGGRGGADGGSASGDEGLGA